MKRQHLGETFVNRVIPEHLGAAIRSARMPRSARRSLTCALIVLLSCASIVNGPVAQAAVSVLTLDVRYSSGDTAAQPGGIVDLRAAMPVSGPGTISQTIRQDIDPAKVRLTARADIVAPAGWTLEYSTDGSAFTSTEPTTAAQWAAIRAVQATGNVQSDGVEDGYQIATGTAEGAPLELTPPLTMSGGTGDGWDAFFDPGRTRVFNVNHKLSTNQVDCHVLATGATCNGFKFPLKAMSSNPATGRIVAGKLWVPGTTYGPDRFGFTCIEISQVIASGAVPRYCDGTDNGWVTVGTSDLPTNTSYNSFTLFTGIAGAPHSGTNTETQLWSAMMDSGNLYCLDTAKRAPCTGQPSNGWPMYWPENGAYLEQPPVHNVVIWDGRVYVTVAKGTTDM